MSIAEQTSNVAPSVLEAIDAFADLPTLAPVAVELMRVIDNDSSRMSDIAAVIGRDPGLASKLLRTANSAMYSTNGGVSSLERATAILGLRTVKLLSLGFSLMSVGSSDSEFDVALSWRRSVAISVLARNFAMRSNPRLSDEAFIAGLLANISKVALASNPEFLAAVRDGQGWPTATAERTHMGTTSNALSGMILTSWDLPRPLAESIANIDSPECADDIAGELAGLLQVSDAAAAVLLAGTDVNRATIDRLVLASATQMAATAETVLEEVDDASDAINEIADVLQVESVATQPASTIMAEAQNRLVAISMDVATALQEEQKRVETLMHDNARLANEAASDSLTGLSNRRTFDAFFEAQLAARARGNRSGSIGLLLLDLDHFKTVNDQQGHTVGDDVLREVGERLRTGTRREELPARVGGEEFAIVMPETSREGIAIAADRIRMLISDEPIQTSAGPLTVTVSVGAALTERCTPETAADLYAVADGALYEAKHAGRNRSQVAPPF